jgi:hypothetical protein
MSGGGNRRQATGDGQSRGHVEGSVASILAVARSLSPIAIFTPPVARSLSPVAIFSARASQ